MSPTMRFVPLRLRIAGMFGALAAQVAQHVKAVVGAHQPLTILKL